MNHENQEAPPVDKHEVTGYNISHLEGKLLTLIDATFSDREQKKAFKSIITQTLWGWFQDIEEFNELPEHIQAAIE